MRLFRALPVLSLLVGARASSLQSREPDAHPLDARDLLDVCASVNAELVVPDLLGVLTAVGVVDVCLCLSALPLFLETNVIALLAVDIAGEKVVTDILANLILGKAPQSHCNYPAHSVPACIDGNPCRFRGTQPRALAAHPTWSATASAWLPARVPLATRSPKDAGSAPGSCKEMGRGWDACGVFGGGARAWECVDTAHDLESCGGCVLPLTPYSPIGQDCTAIPGVADVACHSGECMVRRCLPGYVVSDDGTSCRSKHSHSHSHVASPEEDGEYAEAVHYGLEHRPL
ncbi:hypothetical protein EDB92DRAFT_1818040 [Lactarius akahatsu]|uniref:Protein CPL1-like domain-containing protein n=1 Tax=Lactarius akahatsu TaxID=416441 RepID=A0AAD4LG19_9AGAM|nr:hypothetical protein EDB92DRAFT_1818040 [Lactarius akahatsu]